MPDCTTPPSTFGREFHPEQLDLDQFAAAIRFLLAPHQHDLLSVPDQGIHVVSASKPN
jgi:hypothetical protein